jgi:uncharacterized protein YndB with AHSA1/START domain
MTDASPHPETANDRNTVHHLFEIAAPREKVWGALTTADGLLGWWTTDVAAEEAVRGAEIQFRFRGPFNPRMRIVEMASPRLLEWEGIGGHAALGERMGIRFELEESETGTRVRFKHRLGDEINADGVASANFNWGYYLDSLRLLCETGTGKPFRQGVSGARVGASGTSRNTGVIYRLGSLAIPGPQER